MRLNAATTVNWVGQFGGSIPTSAQVSDNGSELHRLGFVQRRERQGWWLAQHLHHGSCRPPTVRSVEGAARSLQLWPSEDPDGSLSPSPLSSSSTYGTVRRASPVCRDVRVGHGVYVRPGRRAEAPRGRYCRAGSLNQGLGECVAMSAGEADHHPSTHSPSTSDGVSDVHHELSGSGPDLHRLPSV